jgi:hypothetical protein
MIVLDTDVVPELMRPAPAPVVLTWLVRRAAEHGPLHHRHHRHRGSPRNRPAPRRPPQERALQGCGGGLRSFPEQVLSFDVRAAAAYADVVTGRERAGIPIDGFDAQIASICRIHGATLATRNVKDFHNTGVRVIDPWQEPTSC